MKAPLMIFIEGIVLIIWGFGMFLMTHSHIALLIPITGIGCFMIAINMQR